MRAVVSVALAGLVAALMVVPATAKCLPPPPGGQARVVELHPALTVGGDPIPGRCWMKIVRDGESLTGESRDAALCRSRPPAAVQIQIGIFCCDKGECPDKLLWLDAAGERQEASTRLTFAIVAAPPRQH
jgi:hypothetical protein